MVKNYSLFFGKSIGQTRKFCPPFAINDKSGTLAKVQVKATKRRQKILKFIFHELDRRLTEHGSDAKRGSCRR
jgi:hypothetical protein